MPHNDTAPTFALLTAFDARTWSGVTVATHDSTNITLPTYGTGEGVYEDALFFLNGRGSDTSNTLGTLIQTLSNFGTWSARLNSSDKVQIVCNEAFTLSTNYTGTDELGVGSSDITSVVDGSDHVATCAVDWERGPYRGARYTLTQTASPNNSFNMPSATADAQDITCMLRQRGSVSDADDALSSNSLEATHISALSNVNVRWILNETGHVELRYASSVGAFAWVSTTFRDRLGFSGNESPAVDGSWRVITADYPCGGVLVPTRPLDDHHLSVETVGNSRRLINGGYTSQYTGTYTRSIIRLHIDAEADVRDLYRHFEAEWLQYCGLGERVNLYQDWGDSRRAIRTAQVNASQSAYDTQSTSELNGQRGRIRGHLIGHGLIDLDYTTRIRRRVPVQLTIEHI